MVSAWWLIAAFVGGGLTGFLLIALLRVAGKPEQSATHVPNLNGMPW